MVARDAPLQEHLFQPKVSAIGRMPKAGIGYDVWISQCALLMTNTSENTTDDANQRLLDRRVDLLGFVCHLFDRSNAEHYCGRASRVHSGKLQQIRSPYSNARWC